MCSMYLIYHNDLTMLHDLFEAQEPVWAEWYCFSAGFRFSTSRIIKQS